jgi:GNAT superfamily N-acetyltransferase
MATISIVPTMETISNNTTKFNTVELAIFNGARQVGEAKLILMNYAEMRESGERLETFARRISEDMHLSLSAMSKHSLFACEVLCDTDRMYCRVPIIAYLSRIYVYPEYRGKGYGKAFVQMLPAAIKQLTLSAPLAIAVYICPQTKIMTHNGLTAEIPKKDLKAMQTQMEKMFADAGYIKPSKALNHKRCMVWTEGSIT